MKVSRPCLQYHMHLCSAPCGGHVDHIDYDRDVKTICDLLEGKSTVLVKELTRQMMEASEAMDFEKAAKLRDHIRAIQSVQQRQHGTRRQSHGTRDLLYPLWPHGGEGEFQYP